MNSEVKKTLNLFDKVMNNKNNLQAMTETYKQNREYLKSISKVLKLLRQTEAADGTINELLKSEIYDPENKLTFKTFHQWKAEGYSVIKGEKAFLFWGKPIKEKQDEPEQPEQPEEEADDFKFYPLCYLFSNQQVKKL